MSTTRRETSLIRKLLSFTVLGFLIVALAGPVFAIIGSVITFTLVGAIAWGTYHLCRHLLGIRGDGFRERLRQPGPPPKAPRPEAPAASPVVSSSPQHRGCALRRVSVVLVEVICGVLVGGGLGLIAGLQRPDAAEWFITGGAAAGAVLGFLAGRSAPDVAPDAGSASS